MVPGLCVDITTIILIYSLDNPISCFLFDEARSMTSSRKECYDVALTFPVTWDSAVFFLVLPVYTPSVAHSRFIDARFVESVIYLFGNTRRDFSRARPPLCGGYKNNPLMCSLIMRRLSDIGKKFSARLTFLPVTFSDNNILIMRTKNFVIVYPIKFFIFYMNKLDQNAIYLSLIWRKIYISIILSRWHEFNINH